MTFFQARHTSIWNNRNDTTLWRRGHTGKNSWSLTTLREKLVKIGARIVRHGRYVVFQLAEVAVPRALFAGILRRIDELRPPPPPLPA